MITAAKQAKNPSATSAINKENPQKYHSKQIAPTISSESHNASKINGNSSRWNCSPINHNQTETKCETKRIDKGDTCIKQSQMPRSKLSCSPQAAAALTNTIAGSSAASTKIQHKQQMFLAAAAKCHQSTSSCKGTVAKNEGHSANNSKASSKSVWPLPPAAMQSFGDGSSSINGSEPRNESTNCLGFKNRSSYIGPRVDDHAPQSLCCCCCSEQQQVYPMTQTAVISANDNKASRYSNFSDAMMGEQSSKAIRTHQSQPSKPVGAKGARSQSSTATVSSAGGCTASDCSGAPVVALDGAKLACCSSICPMMLNATNQSAGSCLEVVDNLEPIVGQQTNHQDQVRRVNGDFAGYNSSGINNSRSSYHFQYYNQHPQSYVYNNYHQPHQYLNSYNNNHNQINHQTNLSQPAQQVMAHYKFHNDRQSSVLTYEQVKRLDHVMDQVVPIHGRGNAPTLYVKLKELIKLVKHKLQNEHSIEIRDVRLNGGAASYVLAPENSQYNDLDLIFGTDLSNGDRFDVIRDVVLECLMEFHPDNMNKRSEQQQTRMDLKETSNKHNEDHQEFSTDTNKLRNEFMADRLTRSDRSSSFESDNLNVSINDSELEKSDYEEEENFPSKNNDSGVEMLSNSSNTNEKDRLDEKSECDSNSEGSRSLQEETNDEPGKCFDSTSGQQYHLGGQMNNQQANLYHYQMPPNNCAIKEAYVHKMVKVNDDDRWSLISLGVQQSDATNCCGQMQHEQTTVTNYGGLMTYTPIAARDDRYRPNSYAGHHQKQFPNSIELKFVDRMRRKFEFSVDSFQIILDTLTQFYDYVPQSTITIQKKLDNPNLSSTMIDTARPIGNGEKCSCCFNNRIVFEHNTMLKGTFMNSQNQPATNETSKTQVIQYLNGGSDNGKTGGSRAKHSASSINGTRGLYELSLDQRDSMILNSSVASSSGCSSSSSVVSSLSSSLSCDEEQEDLYCEAEHSQSSSASTSSLLSSTITSTSTSNSSQDNCHQLQSKDYRTKQTKSSTINAKVRMAALDGILAASPKETKKTAIDKGQVETNNCTEFFKNNPKHNSNQNCNDSMQRCNSLIRKNLCDYGTDKTSCAVISENFYPTVIGRSEYGDFKDALYHLEKKLIATRSPEEIRGGGLLKYCNLLVKNYKPTNVNQIRTLERYMCSRFFIDFSDLNQQRAKLESYLANHFSDDPIQKFDYLTILHNVVQRSTVCLMNHELRLTLNMIRELAYNLNEQQIQQRQQHAQMQDHLQQQQSGPNQSQNSSSNQLASQEQHYYQPFLAKSSRYTGATRNNTSPQLVKT